MGLHGAELIFCFLFGAAVGSFLNVCAYRMPRGESIVSPRSRCPRCGAPIRWFDNLPILSFFLLRGRCRACGGKISWRYPLVEAFSALLSLSLALRFGLSLNYFFFFFLVSSLLLISLIDLDHQIIPDEITLPGILVGWGFSLVNPLALPSEALIGALCGAGSLYLVAEFYYFFRRREGLGGGDLKLLAMIGAFLGVKSLLTVVFFASLFGAATGVLVALSQGKGERGGLAIPFGPFLSLGGLLYLFFPQVSPLAFFHLS